MELNQIAGATGALVTASLGVWRLFSDGRGSKKSGKRLAYSLHVSPQSLGGAARRMRFFPGLLRDWLSRRKLPEGAEGRSTEVYVFLWNSGTLPISSDDFLSKNSLRVYIHGAGIKDVKLAFLSHATVGVNAYIPSATSEWEGALHCSKAAVVELRFKYLPPNHGAVLKMDLVNVLRRVPLVNIVGPVRGLKRTTFRGMLLSINLQDDVWLRRNSSLSEVMVNLSLGAMGGVLIGMVLWGSFTYGLTDVRYWGGAVTLLAFEMAYLISRDLRAQIRYRIPDKLAWWDVIRSERD